MDLTIIVIYVGPIFRTISLKKILLILGASFVGQTRSNWYIWLSLLVTGVVVVNNKNIRILKPIWLLLYPPVNEFLSHLSLLFEQHSRLADNPEINSLYDQ